MFMKKCDFSVLEVFCVYNWRLVRRGRIVIVRSVWNIPVTVADTQVGDADVSGRSEGGVTTPL